MTWLESSQADLAWVKLSQVDSSWLKYTNTKLVRNQYFMVQHPSSCLESSWPQFGPFSTEGFTVLAWVIRRTVALSAKYGKFTYITVLAGANFFTFGCTNIPKIAQNGPDLTIWYFIRVSLEFTRLTRLESSQIWIFWVNELTRVKSWQFSLSQIMTRVKSWPKFFESKFELSQVMGQKNLSAELWSFFFFLSLFFFFFLFLF